MTVEQLTAFFGWCTLLNVAVLAFSTISVILLRKFISPIHAKMFALEEASLPMIYFRYLAYYKIAIMVFNLAPYLALRIIA